MTTAHTATPWELNQDDILAGGDPCDVVACAVERDDFEETIANAEFIVRACNAHDELVAALIMAQGQIAVLGGTPDPEDIRADQIQIAVQAQIRAALAKATGAA